MNRLHIKFVNRLLSIRIGGGEIFDLNIAKALQSLGCEVSFITGESLFNSPLYPVEGFRAEYIKSPYLRDLAYRLPRGEWRLMQLDLIFFEWGVFNLLKKQKESIDVIQICGLPRLAYKIERELKIPTVVYFHGPPSLKYKKQIEKCSAIISLGVSIREIKKIRIDAINISPGVDTEKFKLSTSNIRERYRVGESEKLLLFVGRFVPLKNLPFLIKTFKEVVEADSKIKLMLVGEGSLKKVIEKMVRDYKISKNVIFTGKIDYDKLPQYYSAANAFIITSSYDNFPLVVLEAMSCCLPIIGTRVGGIPLQVTHGENGFLVELDDIKGLKNAILDLVEDENLVKKIGERNREKVKDKFSWLESAKKFKEIYEEILKNRQK